MDNNQNITKKLLEESLEYHKERIEQVGYDLHYKVAVYTIKKLLEEQYGK